MKKSRYHICDFKIWLIGLLTVTELFDLGFMVKKKKKKKNWWKKILKIEKIQKEVSVLWPSSNDLCAKGV